MHPPTEVIVIGGGVVGSSTAYHLARRGARVTLLEQWDIAAAASGASAGGVRQQGRDLREMPLAIAAIARWETLEAELDADLHYYRQGHLKVIETPDDLPVIEADVAAQQAAGLAISIVTGDDLRALAPGIGPQVISATYTADDGHANPGATTRAFAAAAARHGATIRTGVRVTGLAQTGGRITGVETDLGPVSADQVVLAGGAWTTALLAPLGLTPPVQPVGLQMIRSSPRPAQLKPVVLALRRPLSFKQLRDGSYLIGGGWPGEIDLTRPRGATQPASLVGSRETATAIWPDLAATTDAEAWVGQEAMVMDEVPIIGLVPGISGLTLAFGFSGHGFAISPMTGQVVSELVLDGAPSISLDAFALTRFAPDAGANWSPVPHAG